MNMLLDCIESYLREVATQVPDLARRGKGAGVLGPVPGREAEEDVEIEVDRLCDDLLEQWCRKSGLGIEVHSEHRTTRPNGANVPVQHLISSDPFDGSGLYRRGFAAEWWSVLSVFDARSLAPLMGGAVDIIRQEIYLAEGNQVSLLSLQTGQRLSASPTRKRDLQGGVVIGAYLMDPSYVWSWVNRGKGLLQALAERFPGARLWPNGGSCIYPWLARGLVQAYVMFDEPCSEIGPGLAFAAAAKCPVFSAQSDGRLVPYQFDPHRQADREPLLIAACTAELAECIVKEIMLVGNR